ncbi:MAG: PQQ-binding-like beta-propeller repeat protein [Gammaproteobacteria bacterium]|nr:PQQ-binding-like beta-propeller repeat protein [Gammaproteobacteria bacterium]
MNYQSRTPNLRAALSILIAALAAHPATAHADWTNNWNYQAPPSMARYYPGQTYRTGFGFAQNGDVVFGGTSYFPAEFQVSRVAADGTLRWSANLDYFDAGEYFTAGAILAADDGGAYVSLSLSYRPKIARIGADGDVLWIRKVAASDMAILSGGRLAIGSCSEFQGLDAGTGYVLWKKKIPGVSDCESNRLLVDAASSVYAAYDLGGVVHATRISADGLELWDVALGPSNGQSVSTAAIGGDSFYLKIGSELRAYRQSDGAALWATLIDSAYEVTVSADAVPEPIVFGPATVRRLDADSGQDRWSRSFPDVYYGGVCAGDSILFNSGTDFVKLNAATGTTLWATPLPTSNSDGQSLQWQSFRQTSSDRVVGVASINPGVGAALWKPYLQPIDISNGSLLTDTAIPMVANGVDAATAITPDRSVNAAFAFMPGGAQVRVRSVDRSDGSTLWESVQELALGEQGFQPVWVRPDLAADANVVAVVSTQRYPPSANPPYGGLQIDLFDHVTGALLWTKVLYEPLQGESSTWGPKLDADGNVYVDIDTTVPCGFDSRCAYHRLYKFSRQDGAVLWSRDGAAGNYEIFGNDVLMPSSSTDASATLRRLSGVDGSEVWATNELAGDIAGSGDFGLNRLDEQHLNLLGSLHNAKIDVADGATLWSVANAPYNCSGTCYVNDGTILANGDQFLVGRDGSGPYLRREHKDGSGVVEEWHLPGDPTRITSNLLRTRANPSGDLSVDVSQSLRSTWVYLGFIAQLDPVNGILSGYQSRGAQAVDDGSSRSLFYVLESATDHTVLGARFLQAPPLPTTTGNVLVDTTISAHGDLVASLSLDDDHALAGGSLGFHLTVSYTGDQALTGAHLIASLPGHGSAGPLDCSMVSAANCVTDARFGGINASFDIQPGGSVTVIGELHDLNSTERDWIGVGTYGPTSLSEPDSLNNLARSAVIQSLFENGFEP